MRGAALATITVGLLAAVLPAADTGVNSATGTDVASRSVTPAAEQLAPEPHRPPTFTLLDAGFNTGFYTDLVLDAQGSPVLSYYDDTASALVVIRCWDLVCRDRTRTVVDEEGHTGLSTSLVLDGDHPVVSYYDLSGGNVRLARCHDPRCEDATTTTVSSDAPELTGTAVTLGDDGNPLIVYRAGSTSELRLTRCRDPDCGATETMTLDGPGVDDGLAMTGDGDQVWVAYRRDEELRLAVCRLPCTGPRLITLDGGPGAGFYPSVELTEDGLPVVSHLHFAAKEVVLFRCGDRDCAEQVPTVVEASPLSGFFAAFGMHTDDRPEIAFFDEAIEGLVVVDCNGPGCEHPTRTVLDPTPLAGQHLAVASDGEGLAIAYHDGSLRNLRFVRCHEGGCRVPADHEAPGRGIALTAAEGTPTVIYRASPRAGVRILRCLDPACERATTTAADDVATVAGVPDVAADGSGSPVVTFQDLAEESLRVTTCRDQRCPYLEGNVVVEDGSVGHGARIMVGEDGRPVLVHRDESRRRIELLRCRTPACATPEKFDVAPTDGRGGAVEVGPGERVGEVTVVYHDDLTGRLVARVCADANCGEPSTLAAASEPAPLTVAVRRGKVAAVHRNARSGELELVVCDVPCRAASHVPLPAGASHPVVRWDGSQLEVVYGTARGTVRTRCEPEACEAAGPVLPVVGATAVTEVAGRRSFVAVLADGSGLPAFASCGPDRCRPVVPELVPIP